MLDQPSIDSLTFEQALQELETIVRGLEEGNNTLEGAVLAYERGAKLKTYCEEKLRLARTKIDQIVIGTDQSISSQSISFEDTGS